MKNFKLILAAGALLAGGASSVLRAAACDCIVDDCGITNFRSNFGVDPCRKLLVNFIDPVRDDGAGGYEEDGAADAITCFSGNFGLNETRTLGTNRICPVVDVPLDIACVLCDSEDRACQEDVNGCLELSGATVVVSGTLIAANIGNLCNAADPCDCTFGDCDALIIHSNLGVDPCRKLLANFVSPVREDTDGIFADDGDFAVTCFSGNMATNENRSVLVNRICPVEDVALDCDTLCDTADRGCQENPLGCLELCGSRVIISGMLLANKFGPFSCPTKDGKMVTPSMRMNGDVVIAGDLFAGEQNLNEMLLELAREIVQLKRGL